MGEKEHSRGDDGEKKKKDEGGEKKKDKASEKKKDDGPITVVLKVDMHCEGCARKLKRSVRGFEGVEAVAADCSSSKLTVVGKVDPWKLRDHVESKTHKKVVLASPADLPKKNAAGKDEQKKEDNKKADNKKPKEPAASTVVLKIPLHCEGCIQKLRRTIAKITGVEAVSFDLKADTVTVRGTMDVKRLPDYLKDKLRKTVVVVPPKKDEGGGSNKEKGDKKKGGGEEGAGKKGKEHVGGSNEGEKKKGEGVAKVTPEANKMEHLHGYGGFGGYPAYDYRIEMIHAPQLFSDENPNACFIM